MKFNLDPLLYYFDQRQKSLQEIGKTYRKLFSESDKNNSDLKLNVDKVSKVYDNGIKALDNMNLEFKKGEFVVFLGPSGCGKTTLLRMIAGLEKISDGHIKMNNAIINSTSPKDRGVAMVFQNYALYPFMTVFNNIKFGLKNKTNSNKVYDLLDHNVKIAKNHNYENIQKLKAKRSLIKKGTPNQIDDILSKKRLLKVAKIKNDEKQIKKIILELNQDKLKAKQIIKSKEVRKELHNIKQQIAKLTAMGIKNRNDKDVKKAIQKRREAYNVWKNYMPKRIEDTLKMLGIHMYSNRKPAELSGGQRQRVALARAISKQSSLFLYDEPLSNLDAKLRGRMRIEIRKIHDAIGATSIYVTHDQLEAMSMADRIVVMNKGYIQQIGTPKELIDSPNNIFVSQFVGNSDVNIFDAQKIKNKNKIKILNSEISLTNSKMINSIDWNKYKKLKAIIRPEHVITNKQILSHIKINKFKGKVISTEFLGNDILVGMEVPKMGNMKAFFSNALSIKIDEIVEFAIDQNRISLFETKYGYNILKEMDKYNEISKQVWIDGREERNKNNLILHKQKNKLSILQKIIFHSIKSFSVVAKEKLKIAKEMPEKEKSYVAKI